MPAKDVTVSVTDNDTAGLTVSATDLGVTEGANASFTVRLATKPSGDVTVGVAQTGTANSDVTLDKSSLTFTSSNWDQTQTVTVSAAEDDDAAADTATLQVSASGADYGSVPAKEVAVSVTDNDTAGLTVSATDLGVTEGANASFTVRLATKPSGDVTVGVAQTGTANSDVTLDKSSLTFTASNWDQLQTVTVSAAEDDDAAADTATLQVTASGADYGSAPAKDVTVSVTDNDTAGLTVSATDLGVTEGANASFTVRLATKPSGDVTVGVAQTGTANSDVTVDKSSLTFTNSNWDQTQTVTVSAAEDDDASNDSATLQVTASGADYGSVPAKDVTVSVTDNDTAGLTVSATDLGVTEGANASFTVRLATKPSGDVTVGVAQTGTANSDVTLDKSSLTFTAANWDQLQTVTVSAAEDDDAAADTATLQVTASGADYGSAPAKDVTVTVTDNDTAGLTVSATDLGVTEGANASFTVRLATKPSGDVTVGVAQTGTANSDVTLDKSSLTFTASNWDQTQTVTVSAAEDDDAAADTATLQVTASGADYASVPAKDVTVTVTDNDTAGLTVSATDLGVTEGANASFTVRLATKPSGDVTVGVAQTGTANSDVTLDKSSLTFTAANWDQTPDRHGQRRRGRRCCRRHCDASGEREWRRLRQRPGEGSCP